MTFKKSETLGILFEEGFETVKTKEEPGRFFELVAEEADAYCNRTKLEAFESGFLLGLSWGSIEYPVYMQCEGYHVWFFVGNEADACHRIKKLIKKASEGK